MSTLEQTLVKRGSKDLLKKMESPKSTKDEIRVIAGILNKRGITPTVKLPAPPPPGLSNPSARNVPSPPPPPPLPGLSKRTPNKNIVSTDVTVGDAVEFKAKSKDEFNGSTLTGTVIKVYTCNRSGKDYVRIKAEGRIFHKTLSYFKKE